MAKLSKKQKEARLKVDSNKIYTLKEASSLVKTSHQLTLTQVLIWQLD